MVMCGMIAQYNTASGAAAAGAPPGPNLGPVVRKRLRIQGFIVSDSLEAAPRAFIGLLKGENFGKLVIKVE